MRRWLQRLGRHRLVRNVGALTIVQVFTYLTPVVSLVLLNRRLGLACYGIVAFCFALVQVANVALDFGFSLSATQRISRRQGNPGSLSRFLGAIFAIKALGYVLVSLLMFVFAVTTTKYAEHRNLIAWSALPLLGYTFQPIWFFSGMERMRSIAVITIVAKLLGLGLMLIMVRGPAWAAWAVISDGIGQVAGSAIAVGGMLRMGFRPRRPRWCHIRATLRITAGFYASRLASTLYVGSGVVILGFCAPSQAVGAYALAERCYQALQQVFAPLVQAVYPYMTKEKAFGLLWKLASASVVVALAFALVGYLLAPSVLQRLIGPKALEALPILHVFLVCIVVHVSTIMSGYPLAAALDRTEVANRTVVVGAFLYGVGALVLIRMQAVTPLMMAWLMFVAECAILSGRAILLWPDLFRRIRSHA